MDSTREAIANGPGYSGAYQGRYADARFTGDTGCLHCSLLTEDLSHNHDVLAVRVADQPPAVAWFSHHIGLSHVRKQRPTYRDWSLTGELVKLDIPAQFAPDGQPHTYVWRLVDRYTNYAGTWQLGVWVD